MQIPKNTIESENLQFPTITFFDLSKYLNNSNFLFLSDSCLYMIHLGFWSRTFMEVIKISWEHRFIQKVNQKLIKLNLGFLHVKFREACNMPCPKVLFCFPFWFCNYLMVECSKSITQITSKELHS